MFHFQRPRSVAIQYHWIIDTVSAQTCFLSTFWECKISGLRRFHVFRHFADSEEEFTKWWICICWLFGRSSNARSNSPLHTLHLCFPTTFKGSAVTPSPPLKVEKGHASGWVRPVELRWGSCNHSYQFPHQQEDDAPSGIRAVVKPPPVFFFLLPHTE